jgi:hypothetical protein
MIFHKSKINPMHDIIMLIPKEWEVLTYELLETFELLLVSAGFTPETNLELEIAFFALEDVDILEVKHVEDKTYIKRKIKYGEGEE